MGTVAEKLTYLNTTKGKLKDVINMTDANIDANTTFRNYAQALYEGYINVLKDKDTLLDNMNIGTSTGTISGSANLPVYEYKASKLSTQSGTPTPENPIEINTVKGYINELNVTSNTTTLYDVVITINEDKSITLNGKATNYFNFNLVSNLPIKKGKHCLLLKNNKVGVGIYVNVNGNNPYYVSVNGVTDKMQFELDEDITANDVHLYITKDTEFDNLTIYPAILNTEDEEPFVPYGTNWIYTTITGKNLFNGIYYQTYTAGASPYSYKSSSVTRSAVIEVEPNKTYSISKELTDRFRISEYSEYPVVDISNALNYIYPNNNDSTLNYTLTTTNQTHYLVIQISNSRQENAKLQVELNNQVTTYEAYKENIVTIPLNNNEIAGIGDYKDEYIVDKNGKCWLNKKIGKVVLDGSEDYVKRNDIPNLTNTSCFRTSVNATINANAMSNVPQICDRFECLNNTNDVEHIRYTGAENYRFQIFIDKTRLGSDDATSMKNWAANNNMIVYYVLATENLIDLNYTVDLTLFNGINNITNSEDMDMAIKYIKNVYE